MTPRRPAEETTPPGSTDSTYPAARVLVERQAWANVQAAPRPRMDQDDIATRRATRIPDGLDPVLMDRIQRLRGSMIIGGVTGRYVPTGRLGQGSQGVVWTVTDRDTHRDLAFKLLPSDQASPEDLARFVLEAQITAQLEHPGIVPVHDLGRLEDGTLFYSMKRVDGESLADHLTERAGKAEYRFELLQIVIVVCQTLAYAHAKGVIHRDLKPRNIMVGRFGEVLVMDWGLAKIIGDGEETSVRSDRPDLGRSVYETMVGTAVGTPAYMSPEQAGGSTSDLDGRCDIYAIGVILYEILSGTSPYERGDLQRVLRQARDGTWARLDRRREGTGLPRPLVAIVHRAMARDRAERYQRIEDLAEDLRAYLAGRPVSAYAEGLGERFARATTGYALPIKVGLGMAGVAMAILFATLLAGSESRRREAERLQDEIRVQEAGGDLELALGTTRRLLAIDAEDAWANATRARLEAAISHRADEDLRAATEASRLQRNRSEAERLLALARTAAARGDEAGLVEACDLALGALVLTPDDRSARALYERAFADLLALRGKTRPSP